MKTIVSGVADGRVLILFSAACLVFFGASGVSAQGTIPTIYKPFADFTLPSLDGGNVNISEFKGSRNVVLVTYRGWVGFW